MQTMESIDGRLCTPPPREKCRNSVGDLTMTCARTQQHEPCGGKCGAYRYCTWSLHSREGGGGIIHSNLQQDAKFFKYQFQFITQTKFFFRFLKMCVWIVHQTCMLADCRWSIFCAVWCQNVEKPLRKIWGLRAWNKKIYEIQLEYE